MGEDSKLREAFLITLNVGALLCIIGMGYIVINAMERERNNRPDTSYKYNSKYIIEEQINTGFVTTYYCDTFILDDGCVSLYDKCNREDITYCGDFYIKESNIWKNKQHETN